MMVGSFYFMKYRSDWAYTSVYDMLYQRNLRNLAKKANFDLQKKEALETYLDSIQS